MPSYRKDRPGRPESSPVSRERSFEEEEQPRSRHSFSRETSRSGFSDLPMVQERARSWADFVVPESEKADPNFQYHKVFDIFSPGRRGAAAPPPPQPGPRESQRQEQRTTRPEVDPTVWFDLNRVWDAVDRVRSDQRFRPGSPVAVVQVSPPSRDENTRAEHLIRFFGIPQSEAQKYRSAEIWPRLLNPFLQELAYGITHAKPSGVPGKFRFQTGNDGSFWLAYVE